MIFRLEALNFFSTRIVKVIYIEEFKVKWKLVNIIILD